MYGILYCGETTLNIPFEKKKKIKKEWKFEISRTSKGDDKIYDKREFHLLTNKHFLKHNSNNNNNNNKHHKNIIKKNNNNKKKRPDCHTVIDQLLHHCTKKNPRNADRKVNNS